MLKRKILEPVRYVCSLDPAVESGHSAYCTAGWDESKLTLRTGQRPTVFVLGQLTRRQRQYCDGLPPAMRPAALVQCSLRAVEGYVIEGSSGQPHDLVQPKREPVSVLGDVVADAWMDEANFLPEELAELADAVEAISAARPLP